MAVVVTSAIVLLMVFLAIGSYNRLLGLRRKVVHGWRQVDVQLRRRHDVVRKLLTSIRETPGVDSAALDAVMAARERAAAAGGPADIARRERELTQALTDLNLLIGSNAQFATNQQVRLLLDELKAVEQSIASARQVYNALAIRYNAAIRVVPINVIASIGNFRPAEPSSDPEVG
jgi:LemA protein